MKTGKGLKTLIPAALGLTILILDSRSAIEGAMGGLEICLRTVIPSLFPFIFLSSLLTSSLLSGPLGSSSPVCRLFRLPRGGDGILLTGLLGGYPIGAKCIGEAVTRGQLSQGDAERMLVFCNAAGPAFIFGITGNLFSQRWVPWCLWGIQLFSAFCMARLLPSQSKSFIQSTSVTDFTVTQKLRQAIQAMAEISGWIILMRIVITMLQKWCLWYLPHTWQIFISGILELSNGCVSLGEVTNTGLRFIFCSVFLGFGGLCVALQTGSAAAGVKQKAYLPGKLLQGWICFLVSYSVQFLAFGREQRASLPWLFLGGTLAFFGILVIFMVKSKKSCGKLESVGV